MNKTLSVGIAVIFALISCEYDEKDPNKDDNHETDPIVTDPEVFFQTSDGLAFRFSDFDFYDSSACLFYLKTSHEEFENLELGTFTFFNNCDTIYTGSLWPGYMSSIPSGPFISSPLSFYGNYAFRVENWWFDGKPDLRNCPEIIEVLKDRDLLHSGLAVSIDTIVINGNRLDYSFTVTNADTTTLLILDPDEMGAALFHYFTNGLYLYDMDHHQVFGSGITHQAPVPWNSWKTGWLSELRSHESKTFTIHDTIESPVNPGEYRAVFEFPGLARQVAKEELYQGDSRIWLGEVQVTRRIVF